MYEYHHLTPARKAEVLRRREAAGFPHHRHPHLDEWNGLALITAATYEHQHLLQTEEDRRSLFEGLMAEFSAIGVVCHAWAVLPNHYHAIVRCERLGNLRAPSGAPTAGCPARSTSATTRRAGRRGAGSPTAPSAASGTATPRSTTCTTTR